MTQVQYIQYCHILHLLDVYLMEPPATEEGLHREVRQPRKHPPSTYNRDSQSVLIDGTEVIGSFQKP